MIKFYLHDEMRSGYAISDRNYFYFRYNPSCSGVQTGRDVEHSKYIVFSEPYTEVDRKTFNEYFKKFENILNHKVNNLFNNEHTKSNPDNSDANEAEFSNFLWQSFDTFSHIGNG